MIKNYFKIALRGFWRHKMSTLINIIGLSIGISAALVIYLIVHFDFTFDKFYPDSDHIYRVVTNFSTQAGKGYNGGVRGPLPAAAASSVSGLSESAPFFIIDEFTLYHTGVIVPDAAKAPLKFKYKEDMILADQRYFDLFPYTWLAGSKTSLNQPYTVVLTAQKAKKYFPGLTYPQMLGRVVIYGDSVKTTVSGIVEAHKENTDFNFTDFISYSTGMSVNVIKSNLQLSDWGGVTPSSQFFVKLSPTASVPNIEKQLNDLVTANHALTFGEKSNTPELSLQKLSDIHFDDRYASFYERTANKTMLYGLSIIGAFLLLLGCINFINLTTAQASQRAKEIGIRKTLGSGRGRLILQFLSETFIITILAVIISVALAPVILKLFADFIPEGVIVDFFHQPGLILFILLLTIVVSLAAGFYPAIVLSDYKPLQVLKDQAPGHNGTRVLLRKTLTVAQFAIAQFFIMATLLVSKQVYYALHKDLGFQKEGILTVSTPWNTKDPALKEVFIDKIKALPGVGLASVGGASPSSDNTHSANVIYIDGKKEINTQVQERFGDENYIRVYKIKLLAGRNLRPGDKSKALLINTTFSKVLGFRSPDAAVGHFLKYNDNDMQIVGVTGDFYYRSLRSPIKSLAILTRSDNSYFSSTVHIALNPQTPGGDEWKIAIAGMEAAWKQLYPDDVFQYQFFDESIAKFYDSERQTSVLLTWSTGLSIIISCLGLLGLVIYTTNQRIKEIGVRKVLGATVAQIVTLLSTELVLLIALAFVIVTPVAWWAMNKWIQSFADRTPINWWIFVVSGGGMLATALFVSGFQTVKAALANPAESLRTD
jgi:ABC-type antimicrobial peptide transport system permease subunit